MRGLVLTFTFLTLQLFSSVVAAQETLKPTEVTGLPIDELGAQRTTRPIQVVGEDELQTTERSLSDSLNTLPGIQSRLNGSPTISIRGSQSSARTLVFTDGAPLNFADGVGFNPIFIAYENLDHIVLLRGPASSLFGHDAVSGALEFDSEKLVSSKYFGSYGSFGSSQVFAGTPFSIGEAQAQVTAYEAYSDGTFPYTTQSGFSGSRSLDNQETQRATVLASDTKSESLQWKSYNLVARQIGSTPGALDFPDPSSFNNWADLNYLGGNIKLDENLKFGSRSTFKYLHQDYPSYGPTSDTQSFRQGFSLVHQIGNFSIELFDEI